MKQNNKEPEGYRRSVLSATMILSGAFLILEHLLTWYTLDWALGHEWLGLVLVLFGFAISLKGKKRKEVPCTAPKVKPGWVAGNMRAIQ